MRYMRWLVGALVMVALAAAEWQEGRAQGASARTIVEDAAKALGGVEKMGHGSICPDMISHSPMPISLMLLMMVGISSGSPDGGGSWTLNVSSPIPTPLIE